ncbi:PhzF family phenazine biosynthesis protein [Marinococcus luteus]|uniref:PhzF family phenazine biosynthesis protein n=1 Tax=Marinococcus luteus TaxID=1122204 RepID=UPI002ACCBD9E|nr:PhzF family phenazine biosynthesis protein [Marinococcus luteus]MDZ5783106.1 PhzF family phenazine biosynthesis protein [Marinococcus luteus]
MKTLQVHHYDAFSVIPYKGNPAGVVFDGDNVTETEMQSVACQVGFNETAFVLPSESADIRLRFFTPGHEMNLCGHATLASAHALKSKGVLSNKERITVETKAGIITVTIQTYAYQQHTMTMTQASPKFEMFHGSRASLAASVGIEEKDIHAELPIVYGNTGTWTLLVPVAHISSFEKMRPDNSAFPSILTEMPKASVHPFCLETYDKTADMHARHFSSPYSGTVEDPVTGTASGVMGAYWAAYIDEHLQPPLQVTVEQGQEMNKDGRVHVQVVKHQDNIDVSIAGHAAYVTSFNVTV